LAAVCGTLRHALGHDDLRLGIHRDLAIVALYEAFL
jgi:hypothetical protein